MFQTPQDISNGGGWKIEIPQLEGVASFLESAIEVLPVALDDCESTKLRNAKHIIQFAPTIVRYDDTYKGKKVLSGGQFSFNRGVLLISVNYADLSNAKLLYPHDHWKVHVLGVVLHELFEADYWILQSTQKEHLQFGDPKYIQSEHESLASKRALECLSGVYGPHFALTNNAFHLVDS